MMRPSKLDLVVIYGKPVRYSVFVFRVWKYPIRKRINSTFEHISSDSVGSG